MFRRLLLSVIIVLTGTSAIGSDLAGRASVVDGDTIEIHGERISLFGIDAPESRQSCEDADGHNYRCGQQAALALSDYIGQRTVACEPRAEADDRYGRIVAVCRAGGDDISAWLVSQGWALAYRHYSTDYIGQEASARAAKRGIWRGRFQAPWEWRRSHQMPFA